MRSLITSLILLSACMHAPAQVASHYDVVIDELFADPTPVIGLPDAEFIELKNISANPIDLLNWKLSDGTRMAIIKTSFILQRDSFVIICSSAAATAYSAFGTTVGVPGFPSLNNDGDRIVLLSPEGVAIHSVSYDKTWYHNALKSDGGWSLEMTDTHNPCSGFANWSASTDPAGGTPGRKNATDAVNADQQAPVLLRTYPTDSLTIIVVFDESLDSTGAAQVINYSVDNGIGTPVSAFVTSPIFNEVTLKLPLPLQAGKQYNLSVTNLPDCSGNMNTGVTTVKTGLPVPASATDIVINELLFNPASNGYDYVELYNRSDKVTDLKQLYVASRDISGGLNSVQQLATVPYLFFPGDYLVFTENRDWLMQNYSVKYPANLVQLAQLPSLPDDKGTLVLLNQDAVVIDELHYDHKWHFGLVSDESGVALERIDYNQPTQNSNNWTSAASAAGFGTPTYQNSELKSGPGLKASIDASPKLFSPDDDGYEDYCFINYQMEAQGYVANIAIYDAAGRKVRSLVDNTTLSLNGNFKWDGLDDRQQKLPVGVYIIITGIFDLKGITKQFKQVVTLAGKL